MTLFSARKKPPVCILTGRGLFDHSFSNTRKRNAISVVSSGRAARKGDWKCVTTKRGAPLELYNIKEDMEERHNLADQYPEMVKEFDKEMKAIRHPSPNWPLDGE